MGEIQVAGNAYWGAQTQRALGHFAIGTRHLPPHFIHTYGLIKKSAAQVNLDLGILPREKAKWILEAAQEVVEGKWDHQFPLSVFISGSGTQFNMNVNEVIANRAIELSGGIIGSKNPIHPNDDVNKAQSTNDTFPTAMNVAAVWYLKDTLLPELARLKLKLDGLAETYMDVVKLGRTHLQDAVPITLGQEISGWGSQLGHGITHLRQTMDHLSELPIGGTAVGTGLNAPPGFSDGMVGGLSTSLGHTFRRAPNKFEGLAANDAIASTSGALRTLAGSLMKIANDVRWMASGPRCGLGEIHIPENEPGSSIMPGKVNPTQSEAVTQVAVRVYGNDAAIAFAASQGNFELNVYKPVMIDALLDSMEILAAVCKSFRVHCLDGLEPNIQRMGDLMKNSLALVTALNPHIGYDKAAEIAHQAYVDGTSLKETAVALGYTTAAQYDEWVVPENMVGRK